MGWRRGEKVEVGERGPMREGVEEEWEEGREGESGKRQPGKTHRGACL